MSKSQQADPVQPLSLRAMGLLGVFQKEGRVIPTNELRSQVKEGRDAILKAKRELRNAGYVKTIKSQVGGKWSTADFLIEQEASQNVADSG